MVYEHNQRIKQRPLVPAQASVPVHPKSQPPVQERDLRNGPDVTPSRQEEIAAGLFALAENIWSLFTAVGRFHQRSHKAQTQRFLILIVDHRLKLIDEDNLEAKWIIDCLRYAKFIPEDNPETCKSIVTQCLVEKTEDVGIQIEIIQL